MDCPELDDLSAFEKEFFGTPIKSISPPKKRTRSDQKLIKQAFACKEPFTVKYEGDKLALKKRLCLAGCGVSLLVRIDGRITISPCSITVSSLAEFLRCVDSSPRAITCKLPLIVSTQKQATEVTSALLGTRTQKVRLYFKSQCTEPLFSLFDCDMLTQAGFAASIYQSPCGGNYFKVNK